MSHDRDRDRDRVLASLHLALHPATGDAEAKAAIFGVLRLLRARDLTVDGLIALLRSDEPSQGPPLPHGWFTVVPFGKFKNHTLGAIAEVAPGYVLWLSRACTKLRPGLRGAVRSVATWLQQQECAA